MAYAQIDLLADRVARLEELVFGAQHASSDKQENINLSSEILKVNSALTQLAQKDEVVQRFWTAYADVSSVLSAPAFEDAILSTAAKEEIILSGEMTLRDIAEQLKQLESLGDFLNTPAQHDLPALCVKISPLEQVHISSREDIEGLSHRLNSTLTSYNEIVALLSRKFLLWDRAVSEIERKASAAAIANE
jgi:hypothetical protein